MTTVDRARVKLRRWAFLLGGSAFSASALGISVGIISREVGGFYLPFIVVIAPLLTALAGVVTAPLILVVGRLRVGGYWLRRVLMAAIGFVPLATFLILTSESLAILVTRIAVLVLAGGIGVWLLHLHEQARDTELHARLRRALLGGVAAACGGLVVAVLAGVIAAAELAVDDRFPSILLALGLASWMAPVVSSAGFVGAVAGFASPRAMRFRVLVLLAGVVAIPPLAAAFALSGTGFGNAALLAPATVVAVPAAWAVGCRVTRGDRRVDARGEKR